MNRTLIIAAIFIGFAVYMLKQPSTLASEVLKVENQDEYSASTETVGGRCYEKKCLTVYVAPWCPACKGLKPTIVALREALVDEGVDVKVVVGNDSPKNTTAYAKTYPFPVYLDANSSFYNKAGIRGVPNFIVTNREGGIINKLAGGYEDVGAMRTALNL